MSGAICRDPNSRVLEALGITQKHVLQADISLKVDHFPTVTLVCLAGLPSLEQTTSRFLLLPMEEEPTPLPKVPAPDLDDMAARARERVQATINNSAAKHSRALADEVIAYRKRSRAAIDRHQATAAHILARLWVHAALPDLIKRRCPLGLAHGASAVSLAGGIFGGGFSAIAFDDRRTTPREGARP